MKRRKRNIIGLIILLIVALVGSVLFVGAVGGWFSEVKVTLDDEYYSDDAKLIDLESSEYDDLILKKKSFLIFIDQNGCSTADRLKGYMQDYMKENGIIAYKMMFADARALSLGEYIKYYPSVVLVSNGRVVGYLRADDEEDVDKYNDYNEFKSWMDKYLQE